MPPTDVPRVHMLDVSPGNGTRYRLVLVTSPRPAERGEIIHAVAWPDQFWSAGDWGAAPLSWEWLAYNGPRPLGESDAKAIAEIANRAAGWSR